MKALKQICPFYYRLEVRTSLVAQMVESAYSVGNQDLIPGLGRSLEKERATHSSIGWKVSWMEEPGRLQSMGLQRVRKDQVNMSKSLNIFRFSEVQ